MVGQNGQRAGCGVGQAACHGRVARTGSTCPPHLHPVASASGCMVALQLKVEPLRPCTSSTVGRADACCSRARGLPPVLPPALPLLLPLLPLLLLLLEGQASL